MRAKKSHTKRSSLSPASGNGAKLAGSNLDVAALRVSLAKSAGVPKLSRPGLAKLVGAHVNTVALWESGKPISPKYLGRLRALAKKVASGEKVSVPATAKGGRPRGSSRAPKRAAGRPGPAPRGSFDVKSLRAKLGASRATLAKLLGVSAGSILNWESGKAITAKNVARLRGLERKAASGEVALPERRAAGRPRTTGGRAAALVGSAPLTYANVVSVVRSGGETLVRFGLRVPGGGVRAVADVVVPSGALRI
jgi:DNA-binding transcriptional regulator YiaG